MRQYLELTKWKENDIVLGENQNVEEAWNNLKTKLMELREKFVPKKLNYQNHLGTTRVVFQ